MASRGSIRDHTCPATVYKHDSDYRLNEISFAPHPRNNAIAMKLAATLATILFLIASIGVGMFLWKTNRGDAAVLSQRIETELNRLDPDVSEEARENLASQLNASVAEAGLPTIEKFRKSAITTLFLGGVTGLLLLVYFIDRPSFYVVLWAVFIVAIISIVYHPSVDKSQFGGISNRLIAVAQGSLAIIGGIAGHFGQIFRRPADVY